MAVMETRPGKLEIRGGKRRRRERNWAELPFDILFCIFRAVVLSGSTATASAFAGACRPWRAVAASSRKSVASAAPSLLLRPAWDAAAMCPAWPLSARRRWRPPSHRPRLRAASPGGPATVLAAGGDLPASLPPRFLRTRAVCQSRGYLITVDRSTHRPVLSNPLTGEELRPFPPIRSPELRDWTDIGMIGAVLGDPTASPPGGCRILLYCYDGFFRTCVSGAAAWDTARWVHDRPLQLAVVRGRAYALLHGGDLLLFDFAFSFHYLVVTISDKPEAFSLSHRMGPYLVGHDGKVFTVHCTSLPSSPDMVKFRVCQLVKWRWVERESLDGMALFVDTNGSAMLRARPGQWGGKENHVYASGWLWDGWKVFPFGDLIRSSDLPMDNSIKASWPAPLWMLPCSCY